MNIMEAFTKFKNTFLQKARTLVRYVRWFVCIAVPDVSSNGVDAGNRGDDDHSVAAETRSAAVNRSESSVEEEEVDPRRTFRGLPEEIKLEIFSYLSAQERGRAERVCAEFRDLMRTPQLWSRVDLTRFPLECRCPGRACSNPGCYESYKRRIQKFLDRLLDVRPNLSVFNFAFDINDCQDDWLELLRKFLDNVRVQDLRAAQLNWKETPVKPYSSESATWSSNNYNDLMYRHRRRQRQFNGFFDYFTAVAVNLSSLSLPFDWSAMSLRHLARLRRLETLVLESYFVPQPLRQEVVDELVRSLPNLRHLTVTVCVGSGPGLLTYRIASKSLEFLDLSRCQGFGVDAVDLPSLTEFRTGCRPYASPFLDRTTAVYAPCVYDVLRRGAPSLRRLNGRALPTDWRENCSEELGRVLAKSCSCPAHKTD